MVKINKVEAAVIEYPLSWYAGTSEEYMNIGGPFEERDEAIAQGRHEQGGDPFYICQAALYGWSAPDAADVMNQWIDGHDELWWEDGFGGFDGGKDKEAAAEQDLQIVLNEWFQRHKVILPTPTAFCVHTGGEWIDQPDVDVGDD